MYGEARLTTLFKPEAVLTGDQAIAHSPPRIRHELDFVLASE
jgi:hypothetical protein